jgi:hypothetical protein
MEHEIVSEELIRQAADQAGPNSCWIKALNYAEHYRQAGMTPLFYMDSEGKMIYVTTEEKQNGLTYH